LQRAVFFLVCSFYGKKNAVSVSVSSLQWAVFLFAIVIEKRMPLAETANGILLNRLQMTANCPPATANCAYCKLNLASAPRSPHE
jgi:hypothetical protein